MRSVPAFHQSFLKFNSSGDVLYALHFDKEIDAEDSSMSTFPGTFSIVDSRDYSTIGKLSGSSNLANIGSLGYKFVYFSRSFFGAALGFMLLRGGRSFSISMA